MVPGPVLQVIAGVPGQAGSTGHHDGPCVASSARWAQNARGPIRRLSHIDRPIVAGSEAREAVHNFCDFAVRHFPDMTACRRQFRHRDVKSWPQTGVLVPELPVQSGVARVQGTNSHSACPFPDK